MIDEHPQDVSELAWQMLRHASAEMATLVSRLYWEDDERELRTLVQSLGPVARMHQHMRRMTHAVLVKTVPVFVRVGRGDLCAIEGLEGTRGFQATLSERTEIKRRYGGKDTTLLTFSDGSGRSIDIELDAEALAALPNLVACEHGCAICQGRIP